MAPVRDRAEAGRRAGDDLRSHLRAATMAAHDLLDAAMQAASGWQSRADYARFLALQHAARAPLEDWLAAHAPEDLQPPRQTALIARDLAALGQAVPPPASPFALAARARGDMLGAAWVLAGSALGNRSIARQVERIGGGVWPVAFLGDGALLDFWQALRGRIEQRADPCEAAGAARAAAAVFAHFLAVAEGPEPVKASEGAAA
jgi:heme oxygenase